MERGVKCLKRHERTCEDRLFLRFVHAEDGIVGRLGETGGLGYAAAKLVQGVGNHCKERGIGAHDMFQYPSNGPIALRRRILEQLGRHTQERGL